MRPLVPHFRVSGLPEQERDDALFLQSMLRNLDLYISRFDAALQLFEQEKDVFNAAMDDLIKDLERFEGDLPLPSAWLDQERSDAWCQIAARDGALSAFHASHVIEGITLHATATCPSLRGYIDLERLRRVEKIFDERFPGLDMLRNGLAHSAQNAKSRHKAEFNAFKLRGGARIEVHGGSLSGNFLGLTVNGNIHGFTVNRATLRALRRMQTLVYGAVLRAVRRSEELSTEV